MTLHSHAILGSVANVLHIVIVGEGVLIPFEVEVHPVLEYTEVDLQVIVRCEFSVSLWVEYNLINKNVDMENIHNIANQSINGEFV